MARSRRKRLNRALIDAALQDDAASVRAFLAQGADVNARDPEHDETALMLARGDAVLRILLEHGAAVNARDSRGRTAFLATRNPLLLEHGADIDAQDEDGETALMKAVTSADFDQVAWLIARGADVNARRIGDDTALSLARAYGFVSLVDLLISAGTKE